MRRPRTLLLIAAVCAVVGVAIAVAVSTGSTSSQHGLGAIGSRFPAVTLDRIDHGTVTTTSFEGHPLVVTFGASWCAPCRKEYPMLEAARTAHPNLQVMGVLEQDSPSLMRSFMREVGATWPVGDDPDGSVGDRFGITGYPVTFFVDANGYVRGRRAGISDQATLDRELAKIGA